MLMVHLVDIWLFQAADYIAATAATRSLLTSFPIHQVRGVTGQEPEPEPPETTTTTNVKYVFIGVVLVLLASLLIGVLVAAQRKRAQGITWFPEGFFRNNRFVCVLHSDAISSAYALVCLMDSKKENFLSRK
jgi:hypothetical protein